MKQLASLQTFGTDQVILSCLQLILIIPHLSVLKSHNKTAYILLAQPISGTTHVQRAKVCTFSALFIASVSGLPFKWCVP